MTHAILLAAGMSKRLGGSIKKQFLNYNNEPLFMASLKTLLSIKEIDDIILVIPENEKIDVKLDRVYITNGGEERYDSVRNSFVYLEKNLQYNESDKILIHDAARPFVKKEDIERLIKELDTKNAVSLGSKCVDTVKKVKGNEVVDTLNRDELYLIYTPQGFIYKTIKNAYDKFYKDKTPVTDDLQIIEKYTDEKVYVIDSDRNNIKITTIDDIRGCTGFDGVD